MKIDKTNCEAFLAHIFKQMLRAGISTVATLLANASLRAYLWKALLLWGNYVACAQPTVVSIGREIGMRREEMVSDFVNHVFSRGTKADKPYPCLTELLRVIGEDGPVDAIRYLMRVARNRALDLERRHEVRMKRSGNVYGFTQDDEYGVIDPGEACDPTTLDMENDVAREEAMMAFFDTMGQDFVSDTVILADALGIRHKRIAELFFAERQADLVGEISVLLSRCLHNDAGSHLQELMAQARTYILPARFRQDFKALLAYIYRQSNGAKRRLLAARLKTCGY
ncbi:MAG: hypothetical protein IJE07_04580 [Clostridia bacterium]|nr:hypothetical protein [Clostridia bacterium]